MYAIFKNKELVDTTMCGSPFDMIKNFCPSIKNMSVFSEETYYFTIRYNGIVLIDYFTIVDPRPNPNNIKRDKIFDTRLLTITGYNLIELIREIKIREIIK